MKRIYFIILMLAGLLLNGSEIKKGYFPSGKIKSEIFINGNDGWIKKYYKSGRLFIFIPIKDKNYNGISSVYFSSGKRAFEIKYLNNVEDGIQKSYFMSGKLQHMFYKKNGLPIGEGKEFYESGKTHAIWKYDGRVSKGKSFYETGELNYILEYFDLALIKIKGYDKKKNPLSGEYLTFYVSGKLKEKGFFISGIPDKIYQSYYESGGLSYEGLFKNGKPEGEHRIFSENGKILYRIPYNYGVIDGVVTYSHPLSDEVKENSIYNKGRRVNEANGK